jgi:nucleotide-binding universal stress UspA family protein
VILFRSGNRSIARTGTTDTASCSIVGLNAVRDLRSYHCQHLAAERVSCNPLFGSDTILRAHANCGEILLASGKRRNRTERKFACSVIASYRRGRCIDTSPTGTAIKHDLWKRGALMKDLLAIVTPVSENTLERSAIYALSLARHMRARMTVMIATIEQFPAALSDPDNMQAYSGLSQQPSPDERRARTADLVRTEARRAGVDYEILSETDYSPSLGQMVTAAAQVRDLTMLGVHGPLAYPRQGLVEAAMFGSGRPLLLIPQTAQPFSSGVIVIGWDATRAAVRAVHDALPLLIEAEKVVIASVSGDKELPVLASGPAICRYLEQRHINASFNALTRQHENIGEDLLSHAQSLGANLLVMGGFGHAREREFLFGSATRDIFQSHLAIPVLLSH